MNTITKMIPLLAIVALFGCKDKLTTVNIDHSSATSEFTIEAGTKAGDVNDEVVLNYDFKQLAKDNGVNESNFKSLKLKSAVATITNDATFEPLTRIVIKLTADGLAEKTIVTKDPVVGAGLTSLALDVDNSLDVLPYFKATNLKVLVISGLKSDITKEIKMKVDFKYTIAAGL